MKKQLLYVVFGFAVIFLIGIGLIIDRVGGVGVRSDGVSPRVSLSFSSPVMQGVPLWVRWTGQNGLNVGVAMHLVTETQEIIVGSGKLSAASMRVTIPCFEIGELARFELRDVISGAVYASRPVTSLPPGPDCVK